MTLSESAALSANHLAALLLPPTLRRLYIARDADAAGDTAFAALTQRAEAAALRRLSCLRGRATSTRTCMHSASARYERHCASNSRRRMSFGLCSSLRPGRFDRSASGAAGNWADYVVLSVMLRTAVEIRRWSAQPALPASADLRGAVSRQLSEVQRPWR
jgi:Toprim domain